VPDLLLRSREEALILEIAVSHPVDRAKLRHIRRIDTPALELRLKAEHLLLSRAQLLERLVEDTSIKAWLFHPAQRSAEAEWVRERRRRIAGARNLVVSYHVDSGAERLWPRQQSKMDWRRDNNWAEWFNRKHGRYPTLEETRAFERNKRRR
jgi:hypothetical protein